VIGSEIQIHFLAVAFFKFAFESGFSKQVLAQPPCGQVLVFLFNKFSFVSKVSGWLCRVAKIGFKFFGLRFGQFWF
jgi:hypothetical protein